MRVQKTSASHLVLSLLEGAVDGFLKLQDFRRHPGVYLYSGGRDLPQSTLSRAIARLKVGGLIEEVRIGNDLAIRIVKSGNYISSGAESESDWDGKWRIVTFDIPEEKRIIRNLFRRNLKKWGFKHLQKSVWISKKDVYQKLVDYVREMRIEQWVTVIQADKISL